jgi:cytochrome c oxidase subunit 3
MKTSIALTREEQSVFGIHPLKFVLWIFLGSVTMMFAAFTSGYLVRRSDGNWLMFDLPDMFYWSSGIIILSSIFMQLAYFFAKRDEITKLKISMFITFLLGCVFLVMQWEGWHDMLHTGILFGSQGGVDANPAGSFVYVISGVHAVHIIAGLIFLLVTLIQAFQYKIHSKKTITIALCNTFWHYLGALWLYLFIFMLLNR